MTTLKETMLEVANDAYSCEVGTRRAIDEGELTLEDLAIGFAVNEIANERALLLQNSIGYNKAYHESLPKVYEDVAKEFGITVYKVKTCFSLANNRSKI